MTARAPPFDWEGVVPPHERFAIGVLVLTTVLAVSAASWGVVMALAPLLQLRRMFRRRYSEDVSIGYLVLLVPGFFLWVGYGVASGDLPWSSPTPRR